jgi:hypothetical protein
MFEAFDVALLPINTLFPVGSHAIDTISVKRVLEIVSTTLLRVVSMTEIVFVPELSV